MNNRHTKDIDEPHIGEIIKTELNRQGRTITWLAKQVNCTRENMYKIFRRKWIHTDLLFKISLAMDYINFKYIMKRLVFVSCMLLFSIVALSQNNGFSYQAVIRDAIGKLLCNSTVDVRVSVYSSGAVSYVENHSVTTSSFGYVNLTIGKGTPIIGAFSVIEWEKRNQRIVVEANFGKGFNIISDSELQSVPYSKVADYAIESKTDERCDSLALLMTKIQDDLTSIVNRITQLKERTFSIGIWGTPDAINVNFENLSVPQVTIKDTYGFIFYGTVKYKYYGNYNGYSIEMEKSASYSSYNGLSALLFNLEDNRFRFLHFTKFSEITDNYLVIALFNNENLDFSSTPIYLNGKKVSSASLFATTSDATNCVLLTIGDSITTDGYYVKKLRELLGCSAYYNIAVSGAWWGDKEGTVYDGNPQFQGADNNRNNVLGNQVQKILNSKESYNNPMPNIILLSAGTNDANISEADLDDAEIEKHFTAAGTYIPVTTPGDAADTYSEHRKSISGAIRYCVTKLKEQYPKAEIYLLTPIQGSEAIRPYSQIKLKQQLIKKVAARMGVKVISVGEECGINGAEEIRLANGKYLVDGLHPNDNGGWKMAKYISNYIKQTYVK